MSNWRCGGWNYLTGGEYTLFIEEYVPPPLAVIGDNAGNLAIGEPDAWRFEGAAGQVVTIRVEPENPSDVTTWPNDLDALLAQIGEQGELPPILTLVGPAGAVVAEHDGGLEPIDNLTRGLLAGVTLPVDGEYEIRDIDV